MTRKPSRKRTPQEVLGIFECNMSMLEHLCEEFDKGRIEVALWIAVILRTLLYTYYNRNKKEHTSLSVIDQLKEINGKYKIHYVSTAFPAPAKNGTVIGWNISGSVYGGLIPRDPYFIGLAIKKLVIGGDGNNTASIIPLKDADNQHPFEMIPLEDWLDQIVFKDYDKKKELSRKEVIKIIANVEGGAHLDPKVPEMYDTFSNAKAFKVYFEDDVVTFERNPVFVSVRQIAWEVIESFKRAGII